MIKYDYTNLVGKIKKNGNTLKALAEAVGISPTTLKRKISNRGEFTQKQICGISEYLQIDDINACFFARVGF